MSDIDETMDKYKQVAESLGVKWNSNSTPEDMELLDKFTPLLTDSEPTPRIILTFITTLTHLLVKAGADVDSIHEQVRSNLATASRILNASNQ